MTNNLQRFIDAQQNSYQRALTEVKSGKKLTHWIWYIFPQLKGLGMSGNSQYYGIDDLEEARAYLKHPILGARLREITSVFLDMIGKNAKDVFGDLDAMKVRSCMTLFNEVSDDDLFRKVLERYYSGLADEKTLAILGKLDVKFLCGAIAGDIIGSFYERNATKKTDFYLFTPFSKFTDDTVMTVANADWLITGDSLLGVMQDYGNRYPHAGYGGMFRSWLRQDEPQPYNSFGNGSAMRVSPVGWAFDTLEETLEVAKQSAEITHNHLEGIKGAQATAACIFLARNGKSKQEIKEYVETTFGYDLNRSCDDIRPDYHFDVTCQGSVPESIIAFLESTDFESAIRLAVSLGGDADTMGAITGGIAEAFYGGVPENIAREVIKRLPYEFIEVMQRFYDRFMRRKDVNIKDGYMTDNIKVQSIKNIKDLKDLSDDWFKSMIKIEGEANIPTFYISRFPLPSRIWYTIMEKSRVSSYIMWDELLIFLSKLNELTGITLAFPSRSECELVMKSGEFTLKSIHKDRPEDMCVIPYIEGKRYIGKEYVIDELLEGFGCPHETMLLYLLSRDELNIEYIPEECIHKNECATGTCAACEEELRTIERQLKEKLFRGETVTTDNIFDVKTKETKDDFILRWHSHCLQLIRGKVTKLSFKTWFELIIPLSYADNVLTLIVPSLFIKEYMEEKYQPLLAFAVSSEFGERTMINIVAVDMRSIFIGNEK